MDILSTTQSHVTGVTHLVTSLLLLPAGPPLVYWPILGLGWTLIYEMFFYAIFAATLYLVDWQVQFTAVSLILTALVAAGFLFQPQGWLRWYTAPVILNLLLVSLSPLGLQKAGPCCRTWPC